MSCADPSITMTSTYESFKHHLVPNVKVDCCTDTPLLVKYLKICSGQYTDGTLLRTLTYGGVAKSPVSISGSLVCAILLILLTQSKRL